MRFIYPKELVELNKIKSEFQNKPATEINNHKHSWERVFHLNPGMGLLNSRVFDICVICGERKDVNKTSKMSKEIDEILKEKNIFKN